MIKKRCYRLLAVFFFNFFFVVQLEAQNSTLPFGDELSVFLDKHPAEKVYLHTDRDIYSVNDSVWFKIYLTNAQNNIPQAGFRSVYVELIDDAKTIRIRNLILTYNGFGNGDFDLSLFKLEEGRYQLRAYSDYQRNFGDSFLFCKNILLTSLTDNQSANPNIGKQGKESTNQSYSQSNRVDVQFLPEGGYLSSGCPCNVAFIARDENNQPIKVSGWIINDKNEKIVQFSTSHDGMGEFRFFPEKGVVYKALLDNSPDFIAFLPAATDKIQFSVDAINDSVVSIALWKFEIPSPPENYYLIISAKGEVSSFTKIRMAETQKQIKLRKSKFESGINKLTLADSLMRPVAERLIFVKENDFLTIEANTDREEYASREKVNVEIKTKYGAETIPVNLSISVVNKAQVVPLEQYPQNILSYLLLDSELHGTVPNPSYYFKDDSTSTLNKLDLVMQTYGWRNYNWDNFKDKLPDTTFTREAGIEITGKIKRLLGRQKIGNGRITLLAKNKAGQTFISEAQSDSSGIFRFPPSFFLDSAEVFLQGANKHNRKNIEVTNLSTYQPPMPVTFNQLSFPVPEDELQSDFKRMANLRLLDDKVYNPGKYEILLDEVNVVKKLDQMSESVKDGRLRIYNVPDNVLKVDDNVTNTNIWSLITGAFPGVIVSGNDVSIRGSSLSKGNPPLFLLDGLPVEKEGIENIPLTTIDKIEVLKNAANLAIFGARGANGVIAIYTKKGEGIDREKYYKGIISEKLRGYYLAREFYSPNYENTTIEKPDHRATIYWNPEMISDSTGTAKISFFTSDDPGSMLLRVEGLSYDGKPGVAFLTIAKANKTQGNGN